MKQKICMTIVISFINQPHQSLKYVVAVLFNLLDYYRLFQNFQCGKIYKKKLKILNTSIQFQKLRILDTVFTDPYDALFFKVEPLFGIQKLASGCFLHLTITFSPEIENKQIDGKIVFIAYNRHSTQYQKFFIKIQCVPSYSELKIYPNNIDFGKIPMWRVHMLKCKTIKVIVHD